MGDAQFCWFLCVVLSSILLDMWLTLNRGEKWGRWPWDKWLD